MSEGKIVLGPIIGGVSHETAKVWFYGAFDEDGIKKPWCHVFNKAKTEAIPNSPFPFYEVSESPHKCKGLSCKAFVTEILFPNEGKEYCFGINYDDTIDISELKYSIKRSPDKGDIDFSFALISCHKAFKSTSKHIKVTKKMWNFMYDKMVEENSGFLIQAGDQLYCDNDDNNAWERSVEIVEQNDHQQTGIPPFF